jgi:hypothetical protein
MFSKDARWNADQEAVGFGVEIGEYHGVVWVPRWVSNAYCRSSPPPSGALRLLPTANPV